MPPALSGRRDLESQGDVVNGHFSHLAGHHLGKSPASEVVLKWNMLFSLLVLPGAEQAH